MLDAIREYVRNGGVWWEAGGGYSFYHGVVPSRRWLSVRRIATSATSPRCGRRPASGRCSGCKPPTTSTSRPRRKSAFGPRDARRGSYEHTFQAFAAPGGPRRLPLQQMVLGKPHREALAEYGRRNGFYARPGRQGQARGRRDAQAEHPAQGQHTKLTETTRIAEELPFPVLFHIADYLRGGFDKQYPDHLPPSPEVGTAEDLSRLVRVCREQRAPVHALHQSDLVVRQPQGADLRDAGRGACCRATWTASLIPRATAWPRPRATPSAPGTPPCGPPTT